MASNPKTSTLNQSLTDAQSVNESPSVLLRFLGGVALGLLLVAIPFFAADMPIGALTGWQLMLAIIVLFGSGVLGLIFGKELFNGVMNALEGMGGY